MTCPYCWIVLVAIAPFGYWCGKCKSTIGQITIPPEAPANG